MYRFVNAAMLDSMSQMPRINGEIAHIEDSLRTIQAEMNTLSVQLKEFDEKNVAGSEELSRLDTLKGNLEKCRETLLEHDRWNVLVSEAKSFMESGGKLSESADRLVNQSSIVNYKYFFLSYLVHYFFSCLVCCTLELRS